MSLATRCPHCNTLFKVTSGQLQLHDGNVRCGQCKKVFSGIDHLTAADSTVWQSLRMEDQQSRPEMLKHHPDFLESTAPLPPKPGLKARWQKLSRIQQAGLLSLLWALMLQALWMTRVPLAQTSQGAVRKIAQSSTSIQHWFELPATQALQIEGSGLDRLGKDRVSLEMTLTNTSNLPAKWPYIRVTLLDINNQKLATTVLSPGQYQLLSDKVMTKAPPIAARNTVEIMAFLNITALNQQLPESRPNGFKLELLDQGPDFI